MNTTFVLYCEDTNFEFHVLGVYSSRSKAESAAREVEENDARLRRDLETGRVGRTDETSSQLLRAGHWICIKEHQLDKTDLNFNTKSDPFSF